ncbi:efflux transporter outer membrane subunit [Hydrogenophaga sp. 5NK40-0174]
MRRATLVAGMALLIAGCASPGIPVIEEATPAGWHAPVFAHQGDNAQLQNWWGQFNDPALNQVLSAAQAASPDIATARSRVFEARVAAAASRDELYPRVGLSASALRGVPDPTTPLNTTVSAGLQARWVLDLMGGRSASARQANAQADQTLAGWHEARVLVAAQAARSYFGYRVCQEQLSVAGADRDSRTATAQSSEITEKAGLTAPAVAALARASRSEGIARYALQAATCEAQVKAMVAMTGMAETDLRALLSQETAWPDPAAVQGALAVTEVPASVLRQRPDIFRAQRSLMAAADGVNVSRAALWPSISLSGSALRNRTSVDGVSLNYNTWTVGPIQLEIPLLGRSALHADVRASKAKYEAAASAYAGALRQAVAEVEQSLVTLDSLNERSEQTQVSFEGYAQSFNGTEARYSVGLASLSDLEEARRLRLASASAVVGLRLERINAWIDLYVALGGGFDPEHIESPKDPT